VATEALLIGIGALVLSLVLTGWVRRVALSMQVLDVPNARSSHAIPTPRGGGLAIALVSSAGFIAVYAVDALSIDLLIALLGGGGAVALVGAIDDRRHVPSYVRLAVHFAAAIWALAWLGPPVFGSGEHALAWHVLSYVVSALAIVWTLNLFNFMDGIDGIAASEAVFVAWGAAALAVLGLLPSDVAMASFVLGAACCGFLCWNWPPARIFMGDVGSGFLGFVLAVLALAAARDNATASAAWLLLGGVFFVDASVTLLRRLIRRERLDQAHRTHAYQWLTRRWNSHRRVTLAVLAVNVSWLLPAAALASRNPHLAVWIVLAAFLPLILIALWAGAGQPEVSAGS
jgi:Fuc2NAc and GlcNAc transferase